MAKCSMNMLWNTQIENTCIVFRSWHIHTTSAFVASCFAIVLLCVFHEWLRVFQRQVDYRIALSLQSKPGAAATSRRSRSHGSGSGRDTPPGGNALLEEVGLLSGRLNTRLPGVPVPLLSRILRATIYGSTVFISFFLMLVFMTYNAYLIAAVVIGASLGHYIFGATINTEAILADGSQGKGMACH